ncbi:hypothetical protein INT44_006569 [Umbelopsis vinacea]|uniref:Uncharacterized protein n=1 Tax=Umbelopsis vinacea TaxID=44442 RepID=A0A8H7UBR7_9FUNG|nr:hypothetical protein INT44_006569 [Umbelopsis vinacea]KAI9283617.1 hypothetical protein BC943DRAFT_361892 [Umbelopsis sp. AD052]
MASPVKSYNYPPRPDISAVQQSSNAPGSWQYQLTESMLMQNTGGQDMSTASVRSTYEPPPPEEKNEKIQHENMYAPPPEHHNNEPYDITNPQRFGRYIDTRFAPISDDDGRSHKPIRPFSDYEEEGEPKAACIPYGSVLFLVGFVCPPSWWVGSFYPYTCLQSEKRIIPKLERRWRSANRVMTALSILLIAVLLGIMGWYISTYK